MRERANGLARRKSNGNAALTEGREELDVTEAGHTATRTNGRCPESVVRGTDDATMR
jgi:hypothetical protein